MSDSERTLCVSSPPGVCTIPHVQAKLGLGRNAVFYTLQSWGKLHVALCGPRNNYCILHSAVQGRLHFTLCGPRNVAFYTLQSREYCILPFAIQEILHFTFYSLGNIAFTPCSPESITYYTLQSEEYCILHLAVREYCILHFAVQWILHFTPCGPGSDAVRASFRSGAGECAVRIPLVVVWCQSAGAKTLESLHLEFDDFRLVNQVV